MDRRRPDEPQDLWDVPFFDEAFVTSAPVREDALDPRLVRAARIPSAHSAPPGPSPLRPATSVWALVTVTVLVLGAVVVRPHLGFGPGLLGSAGFGRLTPPPGHEEARSPLGHPAPVAFPSGSYQFVRQQPGSADPVTYDPCRPIHYVVNPAREPLGAARSVTAAIRAVSAATGLRFVDDGATTEAYSPTRRLYQPDRYGRRWAPVLLDFTRPADNPVFGSGPIGVGGSSYVAAQDGHLTFVTGAIDIDSDAAARLVADPRQVPLSAIIEHELGHVVGLAHVGDMTQLMYPSAGHGVTSYGSGDLTGLARLGTGRCEPGL